MIKASRNKGGKAVRKSLKAADVDIAESDNYIRDREKVLSLLRKYAVNSLSYLALEKDKSWYFSTKVEGVAAYAMSGRDMVICGDPICAEKELGVFLSELRAYTKKNHCRLIFLFTIEEHRNIYEEKGFGSYKSGEEAVFELASYTMSGGKAAKVRASFHQARNDGLTVHEYKPSEVRNEKTEAEFMEITNAWLDGKHTSLLKFALGTVGFDFPDDKRYFYARDKDGIIQGFMVFNPYLCKDGYIVDIMRRRPGCTHGVMELIFHDAYETMKAEGVKYGSLGVAPLVHTNEGDRKSFFEWLERYNYEKMNQIYGFKPLYTAKAKYAPTEWKSVYIVCFPKRMTVSMGYSAVNVLDTKGFGDYVDAFRRYCGGHVSRALPDGLHYFLRRKGRMKDDGRAVSEKK